MYAYPMRVCMCLHYSSIFIQRNMYAVYNRLVFLGLEWFKCSTPNAVKVQYHFYIGSSISQPYGHCFTLRQLDTMPGRAMRSGQKRAAAVDWRFPPIAYRWIKAELNSRLLNLSGHHRTSNLYSGYPVLANIPICRLCANPIHIYI